MGKKLKKTDTKGGIVYKNGMPRVSDEEMKKTTFVIDVTKMEKTKFCFGPGST